MWHETLGITGKVAKFGLLLSNPWDMFFLSVLYTGELLLTAKSLPSERSGKELG